MDPVKINGYLGYPLQARNEAGLKQTYYCNHGICPMWDMCLVRLTDRIKDIHPSCPFKGAQP